ncbi:hypothetical protein MNEG_7200 [Monoraphidium neglectum]|jgi:small nuclear ribonucleoprotein (snRNP)-like protein|uniref:LSM domain-containing protein n=1 Tax=Monoraphidium neglectum TaxID=145388 RepID=A0A0D2L006_9CHLO|nr:hypothetical protein MNEG_7200 [Monoraphidium neglectum]KIZ00764.1 hypothetical protein MNEG_7200 [Monoraphidium neglectum]|eukprot:XP_013899783.1 hypothetical protein MNEG_7200 [Monoraphidium neglectum]
MRKVILIDGRVIVGDFQCLDKQGNLILGNACEIISHAGASGATSTSGNGGGATPNGTAAAQKGGGGNGAAAAGAAAPMEKSLGTVLVPKEQQKDVQLQVTLSEKAAMLQLAGS